MAISKFMDYNSVNYILTAINCFNCKAHDIDIDFELAEASYHYPLFRQKVN